LLIDYKFAWESIYLAAPISSYEQVALNLQRTIKAQLDNWRSIDLYFNEFGADRILREGYGQLLNAPLPIAERCRAVLLAAGGAFSSLQGRSVRWPRRALIAGSNYVVAQSFRVEVLPNGRGHI
jgi:hypothetical protein